jgi:hypothetical protein
MIASSVESRLVFGILSLPMSVPFPFIKHTHLPLRQANFLCGSVLSIWWSSKWTRLKGHGENIGIWQFSIHFQLARASVEFNVYGHMIIVCFLIYFINKFK